MGHFTIQMRMLSTQGFQIHLHNLAIVCYLEVQYLGQVDEMKQ